MASSGFLPHGFVVTVERTSGYDSDGVPLATSAPTEIEKCARDQSQTVETVDGQQVVVTRELLMCDDVDADVESTDVLVLPDGTRWQVAGEIERFRSPLTGWAPGCVIPIVRASGSKPAQPVEE